MGKEDLSADIRIDKDGIWYYRGMEMFRKDIVNLLYRHIKQDEDGKYLVEYEGKRSYLEVEDTPFIVKSIYLSHNEDRDSIDLIMPDGSREVLDPATLRVGADDILYGTILGSGIEARFSRTSYYQLAELIEQEPGQDKYYICLSGNRYYINQGINRIR